MALYTTELYDLVEKGFDLGLDKYPIFEESYRAALNEKIIDHYYTSEIGLETETLFKFKLNVKMNEIMPYYNQLYKSEMIKIDPITNYGSIEKFIASVTNTVGTTSESESKNTGKTHNVNVYNDTPQGRVNAPLNGQYATDINDSTGDTTGESTTKNKGNTDAKGENSSTRETTGYNGTSPSALLTQYRDTFLNIDMLIIADLEELFMQVW